MINRLHSKTVLITGASAGIGEACARLFAEQACNLILTARREEKLRQLASDLQNEYKIQAYPMVLDVRDSDAVNHLVSSLPKEFQSIDVLVNNAGLVLGLEKAHETSEKDVDIMFDTNVKGVMNMIRAVVPVMVSKKQGHVINVSSIAGHEAYAGGSVYCASKHAVDALTKSLRMELVSTPLRVTAISPGLVETEFSLVRYRGDVKKAEAVYQGLEALVALDIAEAVLFAASRPPHVQIADMIVFATQQAAATLIHRESR